MWFIRNNESVLVCRLYQLAFLFVVVLIPPRFWRLRLWRCCWSLLPSLQVLLFGPCWLLNNFWSPKGDKKKRGPVCLVTHHSCLFRDWILIFLSFFFPSLIYSLTFFFVYFLPLFFFLLLLHSHSFPRRQKCFFLSLFPRLVLFSNPFNQSWQPHTEQMNRKRATVRWSHWKYSSWIDFQSYHYIRCIIQLYTARSKYLKRHGIATFFFLTGLFCFCVFFSFFFGCVSSSWLATQSITSGLCRTYAQHGTRLACVIVSFFSNKKLIHGTHSIWEEELRRAHRSLDFRSFQVEWRAWFAFFYRDQHLIYNMRKPFFSFHKDKALLHTWTICIDKE